MSANINSKHAATRNQPAAREAVIVRTSLVGVLMNILLAASKGFVGAATGSVAIIMDALNNLSDMLSSLITIIGTKLAGKPADRMHPFGHGRAEYLTSMIVSAIVLYAGISAAVESVRKIVHPVKASYSTVSLIIMAAAILIKILMGSYTKRKGRAVDSVSLIASGSDASFDAILSSSVLLSALIYIGLGVSLEAYVGLVISIFIIKSGTELMKETLDDILGHRIGRELALSIKKTIAEEPGVFGAYDLAMHNYGPNQYMAAVHIEVPDTMTALDIDHLERRIQNRVWRKHHVLLNGISIYAHNTGNAAQLALQNDINEIVLRHPWAIQMHGFFIDEAEKHITFDVVLSFDVSRKDAIPHLQQDLQEALTKKYPEYKFTINPDIDLSDVR